MGLKLNERIHSLNVWVARTRFGKWHRLEGSGAKRERIGSTFTTEIRAGLATFFAMAYIIAVNASIMSDSGGTCVCPGTEEDPVCDIDPDYLSCVEVVKRDLVTATAAIAALTTFCMGLFANMPIGLAPGMGLNAYFAYQVVGYHGTGSVSFPLAVTAVFVEGWIFIGLSILGIRQWLARAIPTSIKLATGAGIGLYLTIIGLYGSAGLGVITGATATPVDLAGCDAQYAADPELCAHHKMTSKTMWLGIFCGGFVTALLMLYRVKGAIIAGIALVSIISWPRTTDVTYFPYDAAGQSRFDFFKNVVAFHKIEKILVVQEWNISSIPGGSGQFWLALVTFLYVDILDTTGTLYSMAKFAGLMDKRTGDFEGSATAYIVDASGIVIGSLFGTPPVTAYIESGAGISEGGKTGITAMVTGICFFISLFFAPIFASIPPWATGSTLIIVGSMMMTAVAEINWTYFGDAIPAFLTIAVMPFTYSIAYGLIAGIVTFMILNTFAYVLDKLTNGRIVPDNYDKRDGWSWRMALVEDSADDDSLPDPATEAKGIKGVAMVFLPPWIFRLVVDRKKRFWEADEADGAKVIEANSSTNAGGDGETVIEVQSEDSVASSKEKQ
ncbi:mfs agza xanthine uracil permease [Lipomyces tetrasporus]|uniref:Mfs agza xanthine uracil permease n=1 Tax=Lipomyces tetrasporus TaxID=54092 RepID=A0AAD7VP70_9ASCO|nr:mfs agza xanthine uracil permease [Lipomyces tetrasporus]KAJ8097432.1 mfs agza xanthine uracil permease [Lipomyces tetrasporus]